MSQMNLRGRRLAMCSRTVRSYRHRWQGISPPPVQETAHDTDV